MDLNLILKSKIDSWKGNLEALESAYDEAMVTECEYYTQKALAKSLLEELESIKSECVKSNLIANCSDDMSLIGENGNLRLFMTSNHHIVLFTDGVKTVDLDNPTISEVERWKKILGMD